MEPGPGREAKVIVARGEEPEPTPTPTPTATPEPAADGTVQGLSLASTEPRQLVITWKTPKPAPTDYLIRWSPTNAKSLSYKDPNEVERGNLYPTGDVKTLTLNNLTRG